MTKILGLDLGTNSIGWAFVDKGNKKIIDSGVRIFPEGVVDIGQGEREKSKNAERREHRQARRLHYRKRLRKIKLLEALIQNNMCPLRIEELRKWKNWDKTKKSSGRKFPDSEQFIDWLKMNPYELRERAVKEEISRYEFGRILYHFIQRRGFLSSRKGKEEGAIYKGKEKMEGIDDTRKLIEGKTLGQKLFRILPRENQPFKRITDEEGKDLRVRARYTLREMYVEEFEKIWEKQSEKLGLSDIQVKTKKEIVLNGSVESSRNNRKIDVLKKKYGVDNFYISGNRINVYETKPFKEYIAGKIEQTDDGIRFKSNESVLFWQRPLRSQKNLLGKCTFENRIYFDKSTGRKMTVGATPCPVSHPEYELFRAWQFINNIRFGKDLSLNDVQRQQAMELINKNDKNFDFEKLVARLKLTFEYFNYDNKFKIPGNPTHKRIKNYFTEEEWENHKHDIWHCFYFYDDKELLAEKLVNSYGLTPEKAEKAAKQQLVDGYGSVSLKAIRNILPFLEQGFQYSTAVLLGGVKNAFGERWERFEDFHEEITGKVLKLLKNSKFKEYELIKEIKKILSNPENNFGFTENDKRFRKLYHHSQETEKKSLKKRLSELENLRNPIVQKGLNEMRRLVNDLLDKYSSMPHYGENFQFDRINVELGRDLKNGKQQRQEMAFRIAQNEKANDEARMRLSEHGLKPSRENITKYRLFKEIEDKHGHAVCPYTRQVISITDLLGRGNLYQIEHIFPFSVSLDDSYMNKTLCESNFNRLKGELTPYEFYQKNSDSRLWNAESWEEIERRAYSLLPYLKAKRFTIKKKPEQSDFIARQLNDTRYISKKASNILKEICQDVKVMPGQLTSELRRLWGLNNIVQPVMPLELDGIKIDENESFPHYVVIDKDGIPSNIVPVQAERPQTETKQLLLPGRYDGKKNFKPELKYQDLKLELEADSLPKGKYWLKINISDPLRFKRIFTERPEVGSDKVVYRGRVTDKKFNNESLGKKISADLSDGVYWAVFKVRKTAFIEPEKGKQPKTLKNQVLLYGEVKDNVFSSYIYSCETSIEPGKYWALLDIEFESAEFIPAFYKPEPFNNEIFIEGTVDSDGLYAADCDIEYTVNTKLRSGKYYAVVSLTSKEDLYPVENKEPEIKEGETIHEGNVWVNKHTGEIMFDPKKNREDQRHHAIDAITVALTEQGFLQMLSRYYGEHKDKERGAGSRPEGFDLPWPGFEKDVKNVIENILVSYSRNPKILSKISKTVFKSGKTYRSVGYSARGRLHREYYFGRHPRQLHGKKEKIKGLRYETGKDGNPVYYYHIRKPVTSIDNNKHVNKIVDQGIRKIIEDRLKEKFNVDISKSYKIPENFFFDEKKQPSLFLKNKKGDPVPVRKVRMREYIGKAVQLKDGLNQWVNPYNNHHVVIYKTQNGELKEQVVSFWEVVERIQQGEPVYKLPEDGEKIVSTLQENEMFLIGLPEEKIDLLKNGNFNSSEFTKHLYRVQKISSMYYTFRHHLASTINNEKEEVRIQSMKSWEKFNPVKVRINKTGELKLA